MFTIFHLLSLLGLLAGAIVGAYLGWRAWGILGLLLLGTAGMVAGRMIGHLPFVIGLKILSRSLRRMTSDELRQYLRDDRCATNLVLLELKHRGANVRAELPHVYRLLISDDVRERIRGWAALKSAFSELAEAIPDYNPTHSTEECRQSCKALEQQIAP